MVAALLEALVGEDPGDEALAAALTTIPSAELADALRLLARQHGLTALPLLRRCLAARPDWAIAAAHALATLPDAASAAALAAAEPQASSKAVRTAIRRALYRLRQAGVTPPAGPAPARPAPAAPVPREAWASALDGTGSRGCWVVLEGPLGERTLLSAIVNDTVGLLDFAAGPIAKKRLEERLRAIRGESALPWVGLPPGWALHLLAEAAGRLEAAGTPLPGNLARWRSTLPPPVEATPPVYDHIPARSVADDPSLLERSAELLALPELAGWFLDPPAVQAEALELLQAKESRLVVSDQVKAERRAAVIEGVIEAQFGPEARQRWQRRLEEQAWILLETGRAAAARLAVAAARALADPARPAHRIPFVRALVERSLEVAGEVALGRVPAEQVRRIPRPPRAAPVA
ncbi:MAG TPA: hypothetical protein VGX21_03855 [Methylomirabilota bacterium]|jgi:plasmid stabilization system protein ParE|nr:hypothetical protein [Methylomirabilota bacterium]